MTCNHRTRTHRRQPVVVPHFNNIVNELFNTAVGDVITKSERKHFTNPATNVVVFDDRYELQVALPGFSKEDIDLEVDNYVLKLAAKETEQTKADTVNYRLREFNYTDFKKSFTLPETVDTAKIKAEFNNGILFITLPKKEEAIPQPSRKINIKKSK